MTETEMKQKTCWVSMGGGAGGAGPCLGSDCTAWEFYDDIQSKVLNKDDEIPEGFTKIRDYAVNQMVVQKRTRTGEGGCSALPVPCECGQ